MTKNENPNQWRLRFINDDRKAWLVVPLAAIYARNMEASISHHSRVEYGHGNAYLDEDADAPLFLHAIQKEGIEPVIEDVYVGDGEPCFVRKLPAFRPPPCRF